MLAVDMIDCASITKWKEDNLLVTGITHYHKRENIVVGRISERCFLSDKSVWFSFDTETGIAVEYDTEDEYRQGLESLGFDDEPILLTVEENW